MNSTFSEIELEKIKLGFTEVLSNDLLETMISFDEIADDFIRNRCRLMIQGHLWGESGTPQTITYPATWWDAVKERWFPKMVVDSLSGELPNSRNHTEDALPKLSYFNAA